MTHNYPLFTPAVIHVGWRYLLKHPLQSILMVLGITLGVAVVIAIDFANASASRAFDLSVDAVAGKATHQIIGGPSGIDDSVYVDLRRAGLTRSIAPVVTDYVQSPDLGDRPIQLLGVDPFAEEPFRSYLNGDGEGVPVGQLIEFLTDPGAILLSTDVAKEYGLTVGDSITVIVNNETYSATVVGLLQPDDSLSRRTLDGVILTDIATAQEMTGREGTLTSIDLILPEGDTALSQIILAMLPDGLRLEPVSARSGSVAEMTAAFRTNLLALSMLALVVGLFLIYNTMTFSVVQRRSLFGTLRCLGVTRREVFVLVVTEALIVGVIGAVLGIGLGIVLGQGAVRLVTRTINDLFFVVSVQDVGLPLESLVKGTLIGIVATVAAAAPPAWEAASVSPSAALSRSGLESKAQGAVRLTAVVGLGLLFSGALILQIPTTNLWISFGGTFAAMIGCAMLTPITMAGLMRAVGSFSGRFGGALGKMAPRDVVNAMSRTSVAVAALMVAVSVTIGISVMVSSFRKTVEIWLEQTLQGDVYISIPGIVTLQRGSSLDPALVPILENWPGVARVDTVRAVEGDTPDGQVDLVAIRNPNLGGERLYVSTSVPETEIQQALEGGAVLISEALAYHLTLNSGDQITLFTDQGAHVFQIAGVYYDYGSVQGAVTVDVRVYQQYWDDNGITAIALRLEPGVDADRIIRELEPALTSIQPVQAQANQGLREDALEVFDQTFAITGALNLLAIAVAFIGVLSALLSLQLERQRELGVLRSVGLTVRQLWGLVMLETGLMGAVAGLLSMPTGYLLSLILVYIINRKSFGWTLQMQVEPGPFIAAFALAVLAALLAGVYPARRMGQMVTANAIRFE